MVVKSKGHFLISEKSWLVKYDLLAQNDCLFGVNVHCPMAALSLRWSNWRWVIHLEMAGRLE